MDLHVLRPLGRPYFLKASVTDEPAVLEICTKMKLNSSEIINSDSFGLLKKGTSKKGRAAVIVW